MSTRNHIFAALLVTPMLVGTALAGPFTDGEARLSDAYADYRAALFQTNQHNKQATEASLASFQAKWLALTTEWRQLPPPQYADDPRLVETLSEVARTGEEALKLAASGDLARSHDALEKIRDSIGSLRSRNGVLTFSDRMNAYHEVMEHLLEAKDASPGEIGEQAAVLAYLAKAIGENAPKTADKSAFEAAFGPLQASVDALRTAARSGDRAAIEASRKGLKPAYSRLFLRFG